MTFQIITNASSLNPQTCASFCAPNPRNGSGQKHGRKKSSLMYENVAWLCKDYPKTLRESSHITSRKVSHLQMTSRLQCSQISSLSDACQYNQHTYCINKKCPAKLFEWFIRARPYVASIANLQRHDGLQPPTLA